MSAEWKNLSVFARIRSLPLLLLMLVSSCSAFGLWDSKDFNLEDAPTDICLGRPVGDTSISYNNDNLVIRTLMNGHPVLFIVDSGSERTTVTPWVVDHFGLQRQPGRPIRTNGISGSIAAESAMIKELAIGPLKVEALEAAVAPLPRFPSDSGGVVGVLGSDLLAKFSVEYDLPDREIRFYDGEGCQAHLSAAGYDAVAIARNKGGIAILPVEVNGETIPAVFDTGATVSGLNVAAAVRAGVTSNGVAQDPANSARGFGGSNIKVYFHTFRDVKIGSETRHGVQMAIGIFNMPFDSSAAQMLLGLDFLNSHAVILPKRSNYIYVR